MNPELLKLIEALDAVRCSPSVETAETLRLRALYESRLNDLRERHPNVSRQLVESMIERAYVGWLKAQNQPSAMPPRA